MAATRLARLLTYQSERFPLVAYVPLMGVATFAAVAFSRGARVTGGAATTAAAVGGAATVPAAEAPFPWGAWAVALYTVLVFFFFLRVLDEHKDAAQDARYRPELPVPRGLVTLRELRATALLTLAVALLLNTMIEPALLVPMAVVLAWAGFMGREFFVRDWLRARPGWYLVSHMVVMPLVLLYATAADWLVAGAEPPVGTAAFLALAFCNGLVIEVGRKIRPPTEEREGVDSYTRAWGVGAATGVWVAALVAAAVFALLAGGAIMGQSGFTGVTGVTGVTGGVAAAVALLCIGASVPALLLARGSHRVRAGHIEAAAGLWVLASYGIVAALGWWAGLGGSGGLGG